MRPHRGPHQRCQRALLETDRCAEEAQAPLGPICDLEPVGASKDRRVTHKARKDEGEPEVVKECSYRDERRPDYHQCGRGGRRAQRRREEFRGPKATRGAVVGKRNRELPQQVGRDPRIDEDREQLSEAQQSGEHPKAGRP